jgi:hypothetical protein
MAVCRKHGFNAAPYYLWRSRFGGMMDPGASAARR